MTAVVICVMITIAVTLGLGIGLGYNHCFVDLRVKSGMVLIHNFASRLLVSSARKR